MMVIQAPAAFKPTELVDTDLAVIFRRKIAASGPAKVARQAPPRDDEAFLHPFSNERGDLFTAHSGDRFGGDRRTIVDADGQGKGTRLRSGPGFEGPGDACGHDRHAGTRDQHGDSLLERAKLAVGTAGSFGVKRDDPAASEPAQCFLHPRGPHALTLNGKGSH